MDFRFKDAYNISDLLEIMRMLRSPDGCPWDKVQTHESIRQNFIEETYEAVEAIDKGDTALLKEELGDVLMQVVFHSVMEEEEGRFDFDDVCDDVCSQIRHGFQRRRRRRFKGARGTAGAFQSHRRRR